MEKEMQFFLDALADMRNKANVNACFGEPVTTDGRTVIPVAAIAYGFGMGMGRGPGSEEETPELGEETVEMVGGGGGGGGVKARPIAVIEVTSEGTWVKPIIDEQKIALAGVLLVGWAAFWLARALVQIFGRRK